jgi:hypothetical protein
MSALLYLLTFAPLVVVVVLYCSRKHLSKDNWVSIGTAIAAAILVMAGWLFVNAQDDDNRRSTARLNYLLDAYSDLAFSANRCPENKTDEMVESAVAKIQLLGNDRERAALGSFIDEWNRNGGRNADIDQLLNLLRNSFRTELHLSEVGGNVTWFRVSGGVMDPSKCGSANAHAIP